MKALKAFYAQARIAFQPHFSRRQMAQLKAICRQVMRAGGCSDDDYLKCEVFRGLLREKLLNNVATMNVAIDILNGTTLPRQHMTFSNEQNVEYYTTYTPDDKSAEMATHIYNQDVWGTQYQTIQDLFHTAAKIQSELAWAVIVPFSSYNSQEHTPESIRTYIQKQLVAANISMSYVPHLTKLLSVDSASEFVTEFVQMCRTLKPFTVHDVLKFYNFNRSHGGTDFSVSTEREQLKTTLSVVQPDSIIPPKNKQSGYQTWYNQYQQYQLLTQDNKYANIALKCLMSDVGEMRKIADFQQNTKEILGEAIRVYGIFSPLFHDDDPTCKDKSNKRECQLQQASDCANDHKQCRLFNITNPQPVHPARRTSLHLKPLEGGLEGRESLCDAVPATNELLISPGNTEELEKVCDVEALDKIMGIDDDQEKLAKAVQRQQKWTDTFTTEGFYEIFDPRIKLEGEKWGCHDFLNSDALTSAGTYHYTETELITPKWWTQPVHWYLGHLPPSADVTTNDLYGITVKWKPEGQSEMEMDLSKATGYSTYKDLSEKNAFGKVGENPNPNFHNAGAFSTAINQISTGQKDVVMLASGYSGTGKTYTLLGTDDVPGLVRLSQANVSPTRRGKFMYAIELYGTVIPTSELILNRKTDTKAWTECKCTHEVIVYHPPDKQPAKNTIVARLQTLLVDGHDIRYEVLQGDNNATMTIQGALETMDYRCTIESDRWKEDGDKKWLKDDDYIGMIKRCRMLQGRVRATPNNPESSRGHTFYVYQWFENDTSAPVESFGTLTVGDMAGMEEEIPMVNEYFSIVVPGTGNTVKPEEKLDRVMGHLYQKLLPTIDNMRTLAPDAEDFAGTNASQLFMPCTRSADGTVSFNEIQSEDEYSTSMNCIFLNRKYHSDLYGATLKHGKRLQAIEAWIKETFENIETTFTKPETLQQAYQVFYDLLLGHGVSAYLVSFQAQHELTYDCALQEQRDVTTEDTSFPLYPSRQLRMKDQFPYLLASDSLIENINDSTDMASFGKFHFNPLMYPLLSDLGKKGVDPDECLEMVNQRIRNVQDNIKEADIQSITELLDDEFARKGKSYERWVSRVSREGEGGYASDSSTASDNTQDRFSSLYAKAERYDQQTKDLITQLGKTVGYRNTTKHNRYNAKYLLYEQNAKTKIFRPQHQIVWNHKIVDSDVERQVWNLIIMKTAHTDSSAKSWKDLCEQNAAHEIIINEHLRLVFQAPDTTKWEDFKASAKYYLNVYDGDTELSNFIYHGHPLDQKSPFTCIIRAHHNKLYLNIR